MTKQPTIHIQKEVNPAFKSVWTSKKPYNILRGGRNSFKSSVIALKLVMMMLLYIKDGKKANVVVIRKVASTIRDSVYNKIQWALGKFGFSVATGNGSADFKATVSPFKITHVETGSTFYFYGLDQYEKLKSNDINDIIAVWYEEAAEFNNIEEFDQTNVTFMRQKHEQAPYVQFFWSYNPPRNPYSFINEWSDEMLGEENYLVHHSSYKDDELGFVTEQMLDDINRIKKNDYDYYRYLYLGEAVGLGSNIYNMNLFNLIDELPADDPIVDVTYNLDTGHQTSATALECWAITARNNVILLDTWYYSPQGKVNKKAPSELSKDIYEFIKNKGYGVYKHTIDSAEGGFRNQYYLDHGIRWQGVKKQQNHIMIDYTHDILAQGRVFVLNNKSNQVFLEQVKRYEWDETTIHSDAPKPVAVEDDTVDAFIYFVVANLRRLGLKR